MTRSWKWLTTPLAWSIRWRLTIWYTACIVLALSIAGVAFFYGFRLSIIADTDRSLTICATDVITQITGGDRIKQGNYYTAAYSPQVMAQKARLAFSALQFDSSGDPIYMRLIDAKSGTPAVASSNIMPHGYVEEMLSGISPGNIHGVDAFFIDPDKENELRVLQLPVPRSPYVLELASPWARNEDRLNPVGNTIFWVVAVFVAVSCLGSWALVSRTLRPISEIVAEAGKMRGSALAPAFVAAHTGGEDEIGHLVTALNAMMGRVHRAVAMQRQFTADASHDLRTPLTILRGEIEYALARERTVEQYQEALRSSLDATERLIRIVGDLGELASVESYGDIRQPDHATPIDIAELCRTVLQSRQSDAKSRGISVAFREECEPQSAVILANAMALERALSNVIDNAIKYNKTQGTVEVVVRRLNGNVLIDVIDTGIGISETDQPYIFDRFYRGDQARSAADQSGYGGSGGLGLSIAQHVVASCGGKLAVVSRVDQGSRFTISLPIKHEAVQAPFT